MILVSPKFLPTSISGLVAWLDARYPQDFTLSGSAVIQWNNHGGSGGTSWAVTDAGSAAKRPTYVSGVSVDFDGVGNTLVSGDVTRPNPCSILIGAKIATGAANNTYLVDGRTVNHGHLSNGNTGGAGRVLQIYNGVALATGNFQYWFDVAFKMGGNFSDDSSRVQVNGYNAVSGDAGNASAPSGWTIGSGGGGGQYLKGSVYWALLYNRPLNDNEYTQIFNGMP